MVIHLEDMRNEKYYVGADGKWIKGYKKQTKDINIIIVTSMIESDFLRRAKEAGVDSFWYRELNIQYLQMKTIKTDRVLIVFFWYNSNIVYIQAGYRAVC